jgi:hypothetical protein
VSYNGKTFDHPLLQTRYRLMGMENPFAGLAHFDLLHPSRRAFGGHWPDCRLRTVEACLLGFQRIDDLPGAEAPETWFQWMRQGITSDLPRLVEHNYWDLVSLAALPPALRQSYQTPLSQGADILAGARHYLDRGDEFKAHRHLLSHRSHLSADALLELARLSRRRGESELAVAIWNDLAATGHVEATERLAKHYEHTSRNFDLALRFSRQLMALRPDDARHPHRHRRLLDKLRRSRE